MMQPVICLLGAGLLLALCTACVSPPVHTMADIGAPPVHYAETIDRYLQRTLRDPGSLQAFQIDTPERAVCMIGPGQPFYGWRVWTEYNAKNAYGGVCRSAVTVLLVPR